MQELHLCARLQGVWAGEPAPLSMGTTSDRLHIQGVPDVDHRAEVLRTPRGTNGEAT